MPLDGSIVQMVSMLVILSHALLLLLLLLTRITRRFRHYVHPVMRLTVRQNIKAWIALSVILTPESLGMTIHRRLLPAMNAMRTHVRQIRIHRQVIVLNVTSMPETPGWVQPILTVHRL